MNEFVQKVLVIGDAGVGKSTLIAKYVTGRFQSNYMMTLGADFLSKEVETAGQKVKLSIFDMAGQERFNFMRPNAYGGAKAAIMAFDLTRYNTLENLENWYSELKQLSGDIPVILIGTKADLAKQGMRAVSWEDATAYAKAKGFDYFETSSKDGRNVEAVFTRLTHLSLYQAYNKTIPDFLSDYNKIYENEVKPKVSDCFQFSPLLFFH